LSVFPEYGCKQVCTARLIEPCAEQRISTAKVGYAATSLFQASPYQAVVRLEQDVRHLYLAGPVLCQVQQFAGIGNVLLRSVAHCVGG